jgi:hypothetical protein
MRRKVLLLCGVLSSLLYVGIDLLAAVRYRGYHSFTSRAVSELMARGAPTQQLVDPLFILYDVLVIIFAAGVWMSAGQKRALHITAGLLFAYAVAGLPGPYFFPMNLRGSSNVQWDVPHIVLTGLLVLLTLGAVLSGGFALGRRFRVYSLATIAAMLVFGALTSTESAGFATGAPTPWVGLMERICIGASLLWMAVLAIALLRVPAARRADVPAHGWAT